MVNLNAAGMRRPDVMPTILPPNLANAQPPQYSIAMPKQAPQMMVTTAQKPQAPQMQTGLSGFESALQSGLGAGVSALEQGANQATSALQQGYGAGAKPARSSSRCFERQFQRSSS